MRMSSYRLVDSEVGGGLLRPQPTGDIMKSYKIYKYTNLITGMSYIGRTCETLKSTCARSK